MDMSHKFNKAEFYDVILSFSTNAAAGAPLERSSHDEPPAAVQCSDNPTSAVTSFFVHAVFLSESPYFEAILRRWKGVGPPQKNPDRPIRPTPSKTTWTGLTAGLASASDSDSDHPHQLTEHIEEDELEAAEMVLRCLYQTGLPRQAYGKAKLLLQMYRLADRYQLPAWSLNSIGTALAALKPEQPDVASLLELYRLPAGLIEAKLLLPVLTTSQQALKLIFRGDPLSDARRKSGISLFSFSATSRPLSRANSCALSSARCLMRRCWRGSRQTTDLRVHSEN
jgi:hypothetical protein